MQLIAATTNKGKLEEFCRILSPLGVRVVSPADLDLDLEVEETGQTFAENAYLKAMAFYTLTGMPALADDSGLCVDALGGRPGIHSAHYQGNADYPQKLAALLDELKDVPAGERTARYVCAICCVMDEETVLRCQESCEGEIGFAPAGSSGFGYDPLFYRDGKSFGETPKKEKDAVSHRGKALRAFVRLLRKEI